jgi:hypothetical protein
LIVYILKSNREYVIHIEGRNQFNNIKKLYKMKEEWNNYKMKEEWDNYG